MKVYWTDETEEALAKYVTTDDMDEKNRLFNDHLLKPFTKLIDILLKRYRIPIVDDDIKLNILTDLVMRVERFKPDAVYPSGKKASGKAYCIILIRSWFADWSVKRFKEKKIVQFESCHEIYINKI